jgi:hypothetical protein
MYFYDETVRVLDDWELISILGYKLAEPSGRGLFTSRQLYREKHTLECRTNKSAFCICGK